MQRLEKGKGIQLKIDRLMKLILKGICLLVFAFVFYSSMSYAFACYASHRILFYSLGGAILFGVCYILFTFLLKDKLLNCILVFFLLSFILISLFLKLTCRNDAYSIVDYGYVLDAAIEYVEVGEKFDSSYFSNFTVNAFLMLVLSGLIRFSRLIHLQDYYILFAIVGTFIETITMMSCVFLVYKETGKRGMRYLLCLRMLHFFRCMH